jgi:hypothetical protein
MRRQEMYHLNPRYKYPSNPHIIIIKMNTPQMPTFLCMTMKTALSIWIGFDLIAPIVGFTQRPNMVQIAIHSVSLLITMMGLFAVRAEKRLLTKIYAIFLTLWLLLYAGVQLFLIYSADIKSSAKSTWIELQIDADFEAFWDARNTVLLSALSTKVIIDLLILWCIRTYYKYLAKVEESVWTFTEKKVSSKC